MDPQTPAAPAPTPTPVPAPSETAHSATQAAVVSGKTSDYRAARRAERVGQPLPAVPIAAESSTGPAAAGTSGAPPAPALTRKERDQLEANDRVRTAVDRATSDLRNEIATLRAAAAAPRTEAHAQPAAPAPPAGTPEWKRYLTLPEAPKLANFDTIEDHSAAMALFIADQRHADRQTQSQQAQEQQQLTSAQTQRIDKLMGQLTEARTSDPAFLEKLTPEVRNTLKPFTALQTGEAAGPINVIGEQVYDSPIAPKVLLHFSQHPEDLKRLTTVPEQFRALPAQAQARAHIQWMVREYGKIEARLETPSAPALPLTKTLSDMPAPLATLGTRAADATDPKASAIRRGDTRAYRQQRREERAAGVRR